MLNIILLSDLAIFIISFGVFVHLVLDIIVWGEVMPFYPIWSYAIGLDLIDLLPLNLHDTIVPAFDALILIIWVSYMVINKKVKEFL